MSREVFDSIQDQQAEWVKAQGFANVGAHSPVLGMVEELGEFSFAMADHAMDGMPMDNEAMLDAVADFCIYLAHACTVNGRRLADVAEGLSPYWPGSRGAAVVISELQGRLARAQLKAEQNIRGGTEKNIELLFVAAKRVLNLLAAFAGLNGKTLAGVTQQVWENVVSKRTAATQQSRPADDTGAPAPAPTTVAPDAPAAEVTDGN